MQFYSTLQQKEEFLVALVSSHFAVVREMSIVVVLSNYAFVRRMSCDKTLIPLYSCKSLFIYCTVNKGMSCDCRFIILYINKIYEM